jgi:3-oxoacyl-[acyl-carrier protein] reductase
MTHDGKAVLVTGGARGIGRAVARAFAERGARVAIGFHTREAEARATLASLSGGPHHAVRADLTRPEEARRLVDEVTARFRRLDVVVNNAGIWEAHPADEATFDEWIGSWRRTLDVNLVAAANVCFCAARWMIAHGGGRIVNVSSRGAFRGEPEAPAYAASKAGLNAMSQSLAQRLAPHGITVAVVAPGFVETERVAPRLAGESGAAIRAQSPLGRVGTPEEVANAVVYLASPGSELATGAILDLNGASYLRT